MTAWTPALLLAASASFAAAQPTVTFELLPAGCLSSNDITPDGRYIVGDYDTDGDNFPDAGFRYDTTTSSLEVIPGPAAANGMPYVWSTSSDGQLFAGNIPDTTWSSAQVGGFYDGSGWISVGAFADAGLCPGKSSAWDISGDGSTVVGLSWHGCKAYAYSWTQAGGLFELQSIFNANSRASFVNNDGTVIAGFEQGTFSRSPMMWDGVTGNAIPVEPTGDSQGEFSGMNDDGTVLLMTFWDHLNPTKDGWYDAYKWTAANGPEIIGFGSVVGGWGGIPNDIADDEGTIVGFDVLLGNRRAWIQPQGQGNILALDQYIADHGGSIPLGASTDVALAVSRDGTKIVGHGSLRAWLVTIDDGCDADTNGDGILDNGDIGGFIGLFLSQDLAADFNGDGILDNGDIGAFIAAFFAGC